MTCCNSTTDTHLAEQYMRIYEPLLAGCSGCLQSYKSMVCAAYCSPRQSAFVKPMKEEGLFQLNMCNSTCQLFYMSCGNVTNFSEFNDAQDFCKSHLDPSRGMYVEVEEDSDECLNLASSMPGECIEVVHQGIDDGMESDINSDVEVLVVEMPLGISFSIDDGWSWILLIFGTASFVLTFSMFGCFGDPTMLGSK